MTTRAFGKSLVMRTVASSPLRPGIEISIKTKSGERDLTSSTASRPSLASPTTSTPASSLSASRIPARTMGWLSARTMRIGLVAAFISNACGAPLEREPSVDFGPLSRDGLALKPAVGQSCAFFHAQQPQAGAQHRLLPESRHVKSDAIIAHKQVDVPILCAHFD